MHVGSCATGITTHPHPIIDMLCPMPAWCIVGHMSVPASELNMAAQNSRCPVSYLATSARAPEGPSGWHVGGKPSRDQDLDSLTSGCVFFSSNPSNNIH